MNRRTFLAIALLCAANSYAEDTVAATSVLSKISGFFVSTKDSIFNGVAATGSAIYATPGAVATTLSNNKVATATSVMAIALGYAAYYYYDQYQAEVAKNNKVRSPYSL